MNMTKAQRDRFNSMRKRDRKTGCLIWQGSTTSGGYGGFYTGTTKQERTCLSDVLVHRLSWLLAGNEISEAHYNVLHDCPKGDNKLCSELSHLWTGTDTENKLHNCLKSGTINKATGLPFGTRIQPNGKFRVYTYLFGARKCLGTFTLLDAVAAAEAARRAVLDPWWGSLLASGRAAAWRYRTENKGTTACGSTAALV